MAAVAAGAGKPRSKAFCSQVLAYRPNHAPDYWSEKNLKTVIELWQLTPEMEQWLRGLGPKLADIKHPKNDPHILVRFLRGPWGKEEAENMFRRMIEWRKQNGVDTILDDYVPPQILLDCIPSAMLKDWDRDGDPIYVERGGAVDVSGLLKVFSRDEMIRYGIWTRERNTNGIWINEYERRQGKLVKAITIIYDCKGLSTRHLNPRAIDHFREVTKITQDYFPGPIKRLIIIRAPKIFTVLWSLIRNFFPATTRAKMIFVGSTGYLEVLNNYIDINVLPKSIYEGGSGDTAMGMMQHLDGVESVQAYLEANYPSKVSTTETDEDSLSSDTYQVALVGVKTRVILRGHWQHTPKQQISIS